MSRHLLFSTAHQAVMHAGQYSYQHRHKRGGDFRRLWISRINAAVQNRGLTYSAFTHSLRQKSIQLNRQVLAELAVTFPETFARIVDTARR
jgi:large subunit ribosomal protein L20